MGVVDLGSFKRAARALNTSQSAVSRLMQEFESGFAQPLFDRTQRSAKLTPEGQEVLRVARALLKQRAALTQRFADPGLISPTLRLGVTELAASTWLSVFVGLLRTRYPRVSVEVDVDSSLELQARVHDGKLDMAIVIDVVRSRDMVRVPIGAAQLGWYCAPDLPIAGEPTLADLERQTLLIQGASTGAGTRLASWFLESSVWPASVIQSDSLLALSGMAVSGLGVANLPKAVAQEAVSRGVLRELKLQVATPDLQYVALAKLESMSVFHRAAITIAQSCCDFNSPYHGTPSREQA